MVNQAELQSLFESCPSRHTLFGPEPERINEGEIAIVGDDKFIVRDTDGVYSEPKKEDLSKYEISSVNIMFNHILMHIRSNGNEPSQWRVALAASEFPTDHPVPDTERFIAKKLPTTDDAKSVHDSLSDWGCLGQNGSGNSDDSELLYVRAWRLRNE